MRSEQTSPYVFLSHADVFACIAPYMACHDATTTTTAAQGQHRRWPLALLASSPAARLVAEMQHASHIALYDTTSTTTTATTTSSDTLSSQRTAVLLADTSTPLHKVRHVLGLQKACATRTSSSSLQQQQQQHSNTHGLLWWALQQGAHVVVPRLHAARRWRVRLASVSDADMMHGDEDIDTDDSDSDGDATRKATTAAATTTTSARVAHAAGVRIGDVVTVLVSPAHIRQEQQQQQQQQRHALQQQQQQQLQQGVSHYIPAPPLRVWLQDEMQRMRASQQQQQQQQLCDEDNNNSQGCTDATHWTSSADHDAYAQLLASLPRCRCHAAAAAAANGDAGRSHGCLAHDGYLFTTTTASRDVLALPEAVRFGEDGSGDDVLCTSHTLCSNGGSNGRAAHEKAEACVYCEADATMSSSSSSVAAAAARLYSADAHAHVHKTAQATYAAWHMATSCCCHRQTTATTATTKEGEKEDTTEQLASSAHIDNDDNTLHRRVLVRSEEAVTAVLLGVSRWWLLRPVRAHELPRLRLRTHCTNNMVAAPQLHVRLVDDVFALPHSSCVWAMLRRVVRAVCTRSRIVVLPPLMLLSLLLLFVVRTMTCATALLWALSLLCLCACMREQSSSATTTSATHTRAVRLRTQCMWLHQLARQLGSHITALDLSHTSVTGTHLLVYAVGLLPPQRQQQQQQQQNDKVVVATHAAAALRALDVAECCALHCQDTQVLADVQSQLSSSWHASVTAATAAAAAADTTATSHIGRALALLSAHAGLRLLMAAGSSLDDDALAELGRYTLLREAAACVRAHDAAATAAATRTTSARWPSACSSSSLLAIDLTSCEAVTSLNALALVPTLLQVIASYTSVDDDGLRGLPGALYASVLDEAMAQHAPTLSPHERDVLQQLQQQHHDTAATATTTRATSTTTTRATSTTTTRTTAATAAAAVDAMLRSRLCAHLYHVDLYYCCRVTQLDGLRALRTLQYLTMSQTRVTSSGLAALAPPHDVTAAAYNTSSSFSPPLRVLVAEACDHVDNIDGLAHVQTLRKLYVRSGTLGDGGLQCFARDNNSIVLLDLTFCEALQDVAALASLRTLHTLVLDSTDLPLSGIAALRTSASLHVVSLRYCSAFAVVGDSMQRLRRLAADVPTLRRYVYVDGVGDAARRAAALRAEAAARQAHVAAVLAR